MSSISFNWIREHIPVAVVLRALGLTPTREEPTGTRWPCPIHGSRPGSRSLWTRGRDWHCHSCGRGGRVLALVCALHPGMTIYEAAREACHLAGVPVPYVCHQRGRGFRQPPDRDEDS